MKNRTNGDKMAIKCMSSVGQDDIIIMGVGCGGRQSGYFTMNGKQAFVGITVCPYLCENIDRLW